MAVEMQIPVKPIPVVYPIFMTTLLREVRSLIQNKEWDEDLGCFDRIIKTLWDYGVVVDSLDLANEWTPNDDIARHVAACATIVDRCDMDEARGLCGQLALETTNDDTYYNISLARSWLLRMETGRDHRGRIERKSRRDNGSDHRDLQDSGETAGSSGSDHS